MGLEAVVDDEGEGEDLFGETSSSAWNAFLIKFTANKMSYRSDYVVKHP